MNVLLITGDRRFGPGQPRYELQKAAVERLEVLYWGRGRLWPALPRGPIDVVSAQDPFFRGLLGLYAARALGARLNVQVHADLAAQGLLHRLLAHAVLRRAGTIRVVSSKVKHQVTALGVRAPITTLPVYVEVGRFAKLARRPEKNLMLWVGRFEEEKDPLFAIDILKKIPDATLIMLGKGSLERRLRQAALGLRVEFPGWQDPLPYLARAALVLSTSRTESWGQSIVEALAAGVPVIAPDVGVAREAGATVVSREMMPGVVAEALKSGAQGRLTLALPSAQEWVRAWQDSL